MQKAEKIDGIRPEMRQHFQGTLPVLRIALPDGRRGAADSVLRGEPAAYGVSGHIKGKSNSCIWKGRGITVHEPIENQYAGSGTADRGTAVQRSGTPHRRKSSRPVSGGSAAVIFEAVPCTCLLYTSQLLGVNIFEYEWKSTGEVACFGDPRYGNLRRFHVYEAIINGACRRFAAGELSNGVWGFCLKEEGEP